MDGTQATCECPDGSLLNSVEVGTEPGCEDSTSPADGLGIRLHKIIPIDIDTESADVQDLQICHNESLSQQGDFTLVKASIFARTPEQRTYWFAQRYCNQEAAGFILWCLADSGKRRPSLADCVFQTKTQQQQTQGFCDTKLLRWWLDLPTVYEYPGARQDS